eukprot:m.9839 g.9839  ORF g.9839 m.9839 type:complete len:456 (+) comp4146_c0_seq1:206-1573(+)
MKVVPWWLAAMFLGATAALGFRTWMAYKDMWRENTKLTMVDFSSDVRVKPLASDEEQLTTPKQDDIYKSSWDNHYNQSLMNCGNMLHVLEESRKEYNNRKPVVWRCGCKESGLGDRLKGITAAWMLAMVLGRPFACDLFPAMESMEYGVDPVAVDWRTRYKDYVATDPWGRSTKTRALWVNRAERALLHKDARDYTRAIEVTQTTPAKIALVSAFIREVLGGDASILLTEKYVGEGKEFTADDATNITHNFRSVIAHAHYCASRSLFQPTQSLLALLSSALNNAVHEHKNNPLIVGIHVRFGGKWKDRKRARDSNANNVIECAWNLTQYYKHDVVWLLASDDVERLNKLAVDYTQRVNGTPRVGIFAPSGGKVEHVIKSKNGSDIEASKRLWLDWFLMSEVHTCALIRSSFPRTACYASLRRDNSNGIVSQFVTKMDLGMYPRVSPECSNWKLDS